MYSVFYAVGIVEVDVRLESLDTIKKLDIQLVYMNVVAMRPLLFYFSNDIDCWVSQKAGLPVLFSHGAWRFPVSVL